MKTEVLKAMKLITNTLNTLTESELNSLLNGKGKLIYSESNLVEKLLIAEEKPPLDVVSQLKGAETREEAVKLLSQKSILKNDLISIARTCHVHINKSDKKAILIDKIVEATVGASLRSKAIRETEVKRKI